MPYVFVPSATSPIIIFPVPSPNASEVYSVQVDDAHRVLDAIHRLNWNEGISASRFLERFNSCVMTRGCDQGGAFTSYYIPILGLAPPTASLNSPPSLPAYAFAKYYDPHPPLTLPPLLPPPPPPSPVSSSGSSNLSQDTAAVYSVRTSIAPSETIYDVSDSSSDTDSDIDGGVYYHINPDYALPEEAADNLELVVYRHIPRLDADPMESPEIRSQMQALVVMIDDVHDTLLCDMRDNRHFTGYPDFLNTEVDIMVQHSPGNIQEMVLPMERLITYPEIQHPLIEASYLKDWTLIAEFYGQFDWGRHLSHLIFALIHYEFKNAAKFVHYLA